MPLRLRTSSLMSRRLHVLLRREGSRKLISPPSRPPLTPRQWDWLPSRLVVLDIEGSGKRPDKSDLYIAGILPYTRKGHSYLPARYRAFNADELADLADFLENFDGAILGQNIFDYDYRVLARHIRVDNFISRTIDIRAVLERLDKESVRHLSLQHLATWNIGKGKLTKPADIPALWREGKHAFVRRYNRRDLEITAELWFRLATRRIVLLQDRFQMGPREQLAWHRIADHVWRLLIGRRATFEAKQWHENIALHSHALGIRPTRPDKHFIESALESEEKCFLRLSCLSCLRQAVLVISTQRIINETERCPFCDNPINLNQINLINYISADKLSFFYVSQHMVGKSMADRGLGLPPEKMVRRWIRGLRYW